MEALERLKNMVNKPFFYKNEEVVVMDYCEGTGDDADEVEIYLNNGKTLVFNYCNLLSKLEGFKPISKSVIVLANKKIDAVSSVNPDVINTVKDAIMKQIVDVQSGTGNIKNAQCVFNGANTLINLAKVEIQYRQFLNKQQE